MSTRRVTNSRKSTAKKVVNSTKKSNPTVEKPKHPLSGKRLSPVELKELLKEQHG